MFQSYQSKQINPDNGYSVVMVQWLKRRFNRINPNRSIPIRLIRCSEIQCSRVSIVSIQTDQSRRKQVLPSTSQICMFQSYQSKQINPDCKSPWLTLWSEWEVSIVSIQTDQSRQIETVHPDNGKA